MGEYEPVQIGLEFGGTATLYKDPEFRSVGIKDKDGTELFVTGRDIKAMYFFNMSVSEFPDEKIKK